MRVGGWCQALDMPLNWARPSKMRLPKPIGSLALHRKTLEKPGSRRLATTKERVGKREKFRETPVCRGFLFDPNPF